MKTLKYASLLLAMLFAFTACDEDLDTIGYTPEKVISGSLTDNIDQKYVFEEEKANDLFETFEWTETDFGYAAAIEYTIEIDLAGKNFENAASVASVKGNLQTDATILMVNKVMISELQKEYEFADNTPQEVEFRLKSSISNSAQPVYSNIITATITPYPMAVYPEKLYMIGADFGDWDWNNAGLVEMIPVNGLAGHFWTIKPITANQGFKWSDIKGWDGNNFAKLDKMIGYEESDGNAVVSVTGLYMIYVDMVNKQIAIEKPLIYGIGDVFGSWDSAQNEFAIEGTKASIVAPKSGELRIYAGSSLSTTDWWTREFTILGGNIEYRGNGGDQDRTTVSSGQAITLDFATGKGEIK